MLVDLLRWPVRRWITAMVAATVIALVVGLPTDVIPNPVFGRPVPVTWWSYPSLIVTALLGGILAATYIRSADEAGVDDPDVDRAADPSARTGGIGGLLSFFAVGCPVCNKLVVIALGTVGARRWFEPFQPVLAAVSILLLVVALRGRLRSTTSCPVPASR